jgi:hypothetical protein
METKICPTCERTVLPDSEGNCPSCKEFLNQAADVENGQEFWVCRYCETKNAIKVIECKNCLEANMSCEVIINDETKHVESVNGLISLIKSGRICLTTQIRRLVGENREWEAFENYKEEAVLSRYFTPIASTAWQFAFKGITIGIVIKGLDTAALFFASDVLAGFLWLLTLFGLMFSDKLKIPGWVVVGAILFFSVKYGISVNLFITFLTVVIVGALFGFPAGMFVGSITGLIRRSRNLVVPGVTPEKGVVFIYYTLIPILVFISLAVLYFLWLNPLILKNLE